MALWERVKRTVSSFLLGVWRQGALFGRPRRGLLRPARGEQYDETIDAGQLIVDIGIAR
jgi:phage tail sheath protein FI